MQPAAKGRLASAQAMLERFFERTPYSVFDAQAPRDYCQHGLRPAADSHGFELSCAPAFEVKVYALARQNPGIYASIRALQISVPMVRARPQDPA